MKQKKKRDHRKTYESFRSLWERLNAEAELHARAAAMRFAENIGSLQNYLRSPEFEMKLDELLHRNDLFQSKFKDFKDAQRSERIRQKARALIAEYGKQVMIAGQLGASIGTPFGPGVTVYLGTGLAGVQLVFIASEVTYVLVMNPEKTAAGRKCETVVSI